MKLIILKLNLIIILLLFESFAKTDIIHKTIQNSEAVEIKGNHTRKLSNDGGYMKLYFSSNANYSDGFKLEHRNNISYIINGENNTHIAEDEAFKVIAGNQLEIHFSIPPNDLGDFFNKNKDSQVLKIESIDLTNLDTSSVINMKSMFLSCNSLKSINLSNCNTSSVTSMKGMFSGCSKLISLDLSNVNTSSVTNMEEMFYGSNELISLDLSSFNTSLVTSMSSMFYRCTSLISINLSRNFNTSSVASMNYMFRSCLLLISLDLSSFDTSSVKSMPSMFYECSSLKSIDLSNFNTASLTSSNDMNTIFSKCDNLKYIKLFGVTEGNSKLSSSYLNSINNLIVCQDKTILNIPDMKPICCDYNIEFDICQSNNYIKLYYKENTTYIEGFKNSYRNNINFIIYNNTTMTDSDTLVIQADTKVEIHFKSDIDNL